MKIEFKAHLAVCISALIASSAFAADWPSWRGAEHNGTSPEQGMPERIDPVADLRWSADMPGSSSATPIIANGRVFVVSNNENDLKVFGLCLDAATGAVLWQKLLGEVESVPTRNTMASCSPTTDGKHVYFLSGNGNLYCYDYEGKEIWLKRLPEHYGHIGQQFGYSSSPLLHKGRLYLPILRGQWETGESWDTYTDKDSHLVCLDAATGAEIWKTHRPSNANGESFDSYASAVPLETEKGDAIVVQGGDHLTAHDAATGKELWRQEHNPRKGGNWRLIPSPIVAGDVVIGLQPRGGDAFAILPGEQTEFAYENSHWIYAANTGDVSTPAYYEGRVYVVNDTRKILICLNPNTGAEIWRGELEASGRIWSSPTIADGKLYILDENGQLSIAEIGERFRLLSQAEFGGGIAKSSVAIADGSLWIRTADKLYRVGGR